MANDNQTEENQDVASTPTSEPIFQYDEYWLKKGKEFADNTLDALSNRMQSYINFLNFLIGGSFLGTITYTTFYNSKDIWVVICFILPAVAVLLARFVISFRINKVTSSYPDLRSPLQINKAFNKIVGERKAQLRKAESAVWTCVLISIITIPYGLFRNNQLGNQEIKILFHKEKVEINGKAVSDTLWIEVSGNKKITSTVKDAAGQEKEITKTKDTTTKLVRITRKNQLYNYQYPIDQFEFDVTSVIVRYKDGEMIRGIEKSK